MYTIGALVVQLAFALTGDPEPRRFDPGKVGIEDGATPAEVERFRIRRHLALVETTLREETPEDLSEAQAKNRAALLDELHAYAQRGVFPINDEFPDRRMPVFIDDVGTACAVGHLMIESGAADLAYAISSNENFDFVAEIDQPGVAAWLDEQGLMQAEAAWIQPSYGPCGFIQNFVCGVDGNTYACAYIATECAMVEIAYEGACVSETDSETGDGEVIGEEICEEIDTTSTDGGESTDGSASTDDEAEADSETDEATTGDGQAEPDRKGCSTGGGSAGGGFALLLLVLVGIRRRTGSV